MASTKNRTGARAPWTEPVTVLAPDAVTSRINGDLTDAQLNELRKSLSSTSQIQNATNMIKLLVDQQERFMSTSGPLELPQQTDDILMHHLGLAEANARMAQAGLTPIDSVEGKIRVLEFVTKHVVETAKLEPLAKLEAEKLILQYRTLLITQDSTLQIARLRAENEELEARTQQIIIGNQLALRQRGAIADLEIAAKQQDAGRRKQSVEIDKTDIHTTAEEQRLNRERQIAERRRANEDHRVLTALKRERWTKPRRRAIAGLVALVVVANLVADDPSRAQTPILGQVNRGWDSIYTPIRDGIGRVIDDLKAKTEDK